MEKQDDATVSEIASRYSASELVEVIQELLEIGCTNSCATCIYARYCTVGLKVFDDKELQR